MGNMMKGKTKIELTDIHTGEVETYEEENMVTNALQYFFNPLGYIKAGSTMFSSDYVNYYLTLTGGLLLLDSAVTEDANNIYYDTDVGMTGCAVYNQQNTSDQGLRGSYNATESFFDAENRIAKFVYDFDTAEGNGTIACVALTSDMGGYSNRGCEVEPVREDYPFFKIFGSANLKLCGNSSGISAYDRSMSYSTYGAAYKWIFLIDAVKDIVYYFSVDSTTSVTIRGYRANINTISLFDTPSSRSVLLFEKTITLEKAVSMQYFSYNYDEEMDKLFITSSSSSNVSNNGSFLITEIDVANDYAVTQYSMTNKTGYTIRVGYNRDNTLCYGGYVYLMTYSTSGSYYICREEIGNSANVEIISPQVKQCWPSHGKNKRVYYDYPTSYSNSVALYIIETDTFTLKYPESEYLIDSVRRQIVPIKGAPMMYYLTYGSNDGSFGYRTDYLATINNLDSPVVKTADKTMKVTYTLSEVTE